MQEPAQFLEAFEPEALLGAVFDGRYELLGHLADGGMSTVYRAYDAHLDKEVAVKVLRPPLSVSKEVAERFRAEAEIASALEHVNIIRVTDFGRSEQGYLYFAMDLLSGESLFQRLRKEDALSPREAVPILSQICAGLEVAHASGVIHRDLKPENVFLANTAGGRTVVKILDFGIAKIVHAADRRTSQIGMVVGTPEYVSPEQVKGNGVDARADIYSLGIMAWEMLVGRHPFEAKDPQAMLMMQATQPVPALIEQRPDLGDWPDLVGAVMRACAKDPGQRPTAEALKKSFEESMSHGSTLITAELPAGGSGPHVTNSDPRIPTRDLACGVFVAEGKDDPKITSPARSGALPTLGIRRARAELVIGILAFAGVLALLVREHRHERSLTVEARKQLALGHAVEARALLDAGRILRPNDYELLLLSGEALHRVPGAAREGIDAYRAARAHGPLDNVALGDLVGDLDREKGVAERAARLLREVGESCLPALITAAGEGSGVKRMRVLSLLREMGAEDRVDRVRAYGRLLGDADCDVRRTAARRLGEIGNPSAAPQLRAAAQAKEELRGFLGIKYRLPACGAPEATEALRRIDSARK